MTATLFEQYEIHRKLFKPGNIWKAKGNYAVKELIIATQEEIVANKSDIYNYEDNRTRVCKDKSLVVFEILETNRSLRGLVKGAFASWPKEYMFEFYELS